MRGVPNAVNRAKLPTRALGLAVMLLLCSGTTAVRPQPVDPQKVATIKAVYIFHMLQLTTWPDGTAPADGSLRILFVGREAASVAEALAPNLGRVQIHGRPVEIQQVDELPDWDANSLTAGTRLESAPFVYVGADAVESFSALPGAAATRPTLVVGDGRDFPHQGGMVGFYVDNQRVRIRVNLDRVQAAGLRMSAEFIQHVEVVGDEGDS